MDAAIQVYADDGGANDGIGGYANRHRSFDDGAEGEAKRLVAAFKESHSVGVTIDRRVVGDAVRLGDDVWALPGKEILLDFLAVRVAAYAALSGVAAEVLSRASFFFRPAGIFG